MRSHHVQLVDETGTVSDADLTRVAAALQAQVVRDLSAQWHVSAVVSAQVSGAQPAARAWPVRITDNVEDGALGVHLDQNGHPYAVIRPGADWSVTASHELLEMLVDPYGSRLHTAPSLDPAAGGRLVHYLVEVADPVETQTYDVDGVTVSDFITLDYYHRRQEPGDEYDQLRKIDQPMQVLPGGYISWYDDHDKRWHQVRPDGSIITADEVADLATDFRDSRDKSFREAAPGRHNVAALLAAR